MTVLAGETERFCTAWGGFKPYVTTAEQTRYSPE
jgi:hypothetical protein